MIALFASCVLFTLLVVMVSLIFLVRITKDRSNVRVCILVLGDIGRSPRMQYHALSCANAGFQVDLIGYGGSSPIQELRQNKLVHIHILSELPSSLRRLPRLLFYVVKATAQFTHLFVVLFSCGIRCTHVLVQNPPAIPSIGVAWLASFLLGNKLIIDWHNYGFTILALNMKNSGHILVKIARWYEGLFGRLSSNNLCVTQAMKEDLANNWDIRATTLYDRPPSRFCPIDLPVKHELFEKLSKNYKVFGPAQGSNPSDDNVESLTAFTVKTTEGNVNHIENRPALVISSTSWTEDEDFSILLEALEIYEESITNDKKMSLPQLVCVITGKGPLKDYYKGLIAEKKFVHVKFCTPWLEAEEYPQLLAAADLGVCLHKSSSGLDLPMKVVDMFGCGLPVCAIHFDCLSELVQHEKNGLVFHDSQELATQLRDLLDGFPQVQPKLASFRENLKEFQRVRWDESWNDAVLPILKAS